MSEKELTFGQKAVGLTFNPSSISEVNEIKEASANLIDVICGDEGQCVKFDPNQDGEVAAMRKLAQRHIQEGQMWAVKAATWNLETK